MSRLEDLILLNRSGAITPAAAVQTLWEMQDARRARRQEAIAAAQAQQQGLLDALVSTAQTAASEGQTFGEVRPMLESLLAVSGTPNPGGLRRMPGIDELFGRGGYSAVNPDLDAEDEATVRMLVFNQYSGDDRTPLQTIRQNIHSKLRALPNYASLGPAIDRVIEDAYTQAAKGY